jgi:hypothetical protein
MSAVYVIAIVAIPTFIRAVPVVIALVRADKTDIPAIVSGLAPFFGQRQARQPGYLQRRRDHADSSPPHLPGTPQ